MTADQRLEYLGIKAIDYTFEMYPNKIEYWDKSMRSPLEISSHQYLKQNDKGDIEIYYPSILDKSGILYHEDKKSFHFFKRTRFAVPKEKGKYGQEVETGINIFIPRNTLTKVRAKEKIKTLYMVEGEFKSIYGDWFGLDIVGIGGIHMIKGKKHTSEFHATIKKIIKDCWVETIVLLTDADSFHVKIDTEDKEKDYAERLKSFYLAVKNFQIATLKLNEDITRNNIAKGNADATIECYWASISEKFVVNAKGLDDLIVYTKNEKGIIDDLQKLDDCKTYFQCIDLKGLDNDILKKMFYLDLSKHGLPENFYGEYYLDLGTDPFWFDRCKFRFNPKDDKLEFIFHKDLTEYFRVGTDYYREVIKKKPILTKQSEQVMTEKKDIVGWSKPEIRQDYVEQKGIKNAFHFIPKYTGFTNVPAHDKDYSRIIDNEYNIYHASPIEPVQGTFPNIERFMKHIFQNQYQDKLDIAMDILQLKYTNPLVKLPITTLFSKEKNTGKSTFLKLLSWIYGDNSAWVGNKELEDNFNEYAGSNVLLFDEAVIDKNKTFEMVKSWSTMEEISMNKKGKDRIKVPFFASMFMNTNRINFVAIDDDENRFFIIKVPVIKVTDLDPYLEQKMVEEIPAFLYHLKYERKLVYPTKSTRFWFPFKDMETGTLHELKKQSQTHNFQAMTMHVKHHCFDFGVMEYETTPVILKDELREFNKYEQSSIDICNLLKNHFNLEPCDKPKKFKYWQWTHNNSLTANENEPMVKILSPTYVDKQTRQKKYYSGSTYLIRAEDFLNAQELAALQHQIENPEKFEKKEDPF